MLRKEAVEKGTMDLVDKLMADEILASFNLVGGTALALKIGHRKSVDIDLFTLSDFDAQAIFQHLHTAYKVTRLQTIHNGVFCNGTRLKDFLDMCALIQEFSLQDLLQASETKYPENNIRISTFLFQLTL
ncbi:MAG: nucleotidyl transferase AbiEii/AbiGii toxin family protein [Bacteroidota bacterium]